MGRTLYKKLSNNGSIGVPVAIRRDMGIESGDAMEVELTAENTVVIRPYQLRCIFCKTTEGVTGFMGKGICESCKNILGDEHEEDK